MLADVAFDTPVAHPFSYRVPAGWTLAPGQRVAAPLRGGTRIGIVLALRDGDDERLKPLTRLVEPTPVLDAGRLAVARWIAEQSLSSIGSTCAALLPPPTPERESHPAAPPGPSPRAPGTLEILIGAGRERRLLDRIAAGDGPALVIVPDVEAAARWAQRLGRMGPVARLDSGASDGERAEGWTRLGRGSVRLAVGTRSALLAPLAGAATIGLVDEHEPAHRPPGHPRIHSREVVLERAARESLSALLTAATPSVEMWWRAESGAATLATPQPGPWPGSSGADTRGVLRREALTPPLARGIRETLAGGRRVFLAVSRLTSSIACDECGAIVRCERCGIALAYARAASALGCRLCGASVPLMETCPTCRGRRLSPFGWGAERVEHAVRRRFPHARIARYEPERSRGARAEAQQTAAAAADVVIGTRGALRLFGPGSLGLVGFVSPDQLLRLPDFRAGERMFALLWAAAERTRADGQMIVQSQNPTHYALDAVLRQDLAAFYRQELKFRAELGYPPFRRLAVLTAGAREPARSRALADEVIARLSGTGNLTVYPAIAGRRGAVQRIVVKGESDLPGLLARALEDVRAPRPQSHGIIEVEVDPVEWQF